MRNKGLIISQLVIPLIILTMNLIFVKIAPIQSEDSPSLKMDFQHYPKNFVPFKVNESSEILSSLSSYYTEQISKTPSTTSFNLNDTKTIDSCTDFRNNIDEFLGCIGSKNVFTLTDNYIVASTFESKNESISITAHFNNQAFHAVPFTINLINNALFKYLTEANNSITVYNHPLPRTVEERAAEIQSKGLTGNFKKKSFLNYLSIGKKSF